MAEEVAGAPVQASPAKAARGGKSKARGSRAPPKGKAKVAKAATNAKQGAGKGRRQKVYEYIKAQAVHERLSELKTHFTQLTRAMKPALNELADRTIAKLTNEPNAHEEVPEAKEVHGFLDQRLQDTIASADMEHELQVSHATKMYELNTSLAREECTVSTIVTPKNFISLLIRILRFTGKDS
jgi:hypothetical protein